MAMLMSVSLVFLGIYLLSIFSESFTVEGFAVAMITTVDQRCK